MRKLMIITAVTLLFALSTACSSGDDAPGAPTALGRPTLALKMTTVSFPLDGGTRTLRTEVASTDAQRDRGLGLRDSLDADAGMLFDLGKTEIPIFWMKDMRFPLDFVWVSESKKVLGVVPDIPAQPTATDDQLKKYSPPSAIRYVLEVNAGTSARLKLTPGVQLAFDLP